ncbi:MAG: PAS domain-containing sensor histidine kinase [Deltaproteobacteria bacterium]|nr:MAG: PAS domain-containing sensor histidine kinase [Deltaproteobacteria bacterium]
MNKKKTLSKDDELHALRERLRDLEAEVEETYRSITELTNEVEGEREKFHRFEQGLRNEFCFYSLALDGSVLRASPQLFELFGYTSLEQLNESRLHTSHPINAKRGEVWKNLLAGKEQPTMEWEIYDGEGQIRRIERIEFPVLDSSGGVRYIEGMARDITERRQREMELLHARDKAEQAQRAQRMFLSHMSHELRTPLNGVLGYVQLLGQASNLTEEQNKSVQVIENCGRHLLTLINQVLDFSKIENNGVSLDPRACQLDALLREIRDIMLPAALQKGLTLELTWPATLPDQVMVDGTKLRQVLLNLLHNGIKFTQEGFVMLTVAEEGPGRWKFSVRDTGSGIDAKELSHVFDPFQQSHASRIAGGVGLGLSISHRLVDAMGGVLQAQSQVGEGSEFFFTLPLPLADRSPSLEHTQEVDALAQTYAYEEDLTRTLPPSSLGHQSFSSKHTIRGFGVLNETIVDGETLEEPSAVIDFEGLRSLEQTLQPLIALGDFTTIEEEVLACEALLPLVSIRLALLDAAHHFDSNALRKILSELPTEKAGENP